MNLLEQATKEYTIMQLTRTADDEGGEVDTWTEGETIEGIMRFDDSMQARTAMAMGVTSTYTFITSRKNVLMYHTVLRRKNDGKIFRITSDGDDHYTPQSATLDMRAQTAEEWHL